MYEVYERGDDTSRLLPTGSRGRFVDCVEEFVKYTIVMRPHFEFLGDSKRVERRAKAAAVTEKPDTTVAKAPDESVVAGVSMSAQSDGVGKDILELGRISSMEST